MTHLRIKGGWGTKMFGWLVGLTVVALVLPLCAEAAVYNRATAKATFKRPTETPFPSDNTPTVARESLGKA